jgi:hypothetical protein
LSSGSLAVAALLLLGCPGEFQGLAPDPPETGSLDGGSLDGCASCGEQDSAGPERDATGDANTHEYVDASGDTSSGDDGSVGPDGPSASDGSAAEAAADGPTSAEASCGPLDTIDNCGACGQTCDRATGAPSCDGFACSYACNAGRIDCNGSTAPDTDGCECASPGCCGGSCQTAHDNGLGGTYYDCVAPATYALAQAFEACAAYTGNMSVCSSQTCDDGQGGMDDAVCGPDAQQLNCACWAYDGAGGGHVYESQSCTGPYATDPTWN